MKVGDYVRTHSGCICKIVNINEFREPIMKYGIEASYLKDIAFIGDEDIKKSGEKIKAVLEVGDVITTINLCGEITKIDGDRIYTTCYDGEYCSSEDIKTVVTKEQFKQIEFEVNQI